MAKIDYFHDGSWYIASLDDGRNGFFSRHGETTTDGGWRFVIPGSIEWDAIHQDIYYAHHNLDPCPAELVKQLSPLPPPPTFTPIKWEDNFKPVSPIPAAELPALSAHIAASGASSFRFWFILEEDFYETYHGDGEFHYFHGRVFDNEEAAAAFTNPRKENENEWWYKHGSGFDARSVVFHIEGDRIIPGGCVQGRHDDFEIEDVIRRIEVVLASHGKIEWGARSK
ncbi:MAG: hypothetical protein ABSF43_17005 [Rectinemataceae bacterium]|jgi:hypothetical protein